MREEREEAVGKLMTELHNVHAYKKVKRKLISRESWGAINFEGISDEIDMVFSFVEDLRALPVQRLTNLSTSGLTSSLSSIQKLLNRIDNFEINRNPTGIRDQLQLNFRDAVEKLSNLAVPCIPYLAYVDAGVTQLLGEVNKELEDSKRVIRDTVDSANTTAEAVESIRNQAIKHASDAKQGKEKAEKAAAAFGAAKFSDEFENEAKALNCSSNKWLCVTALLAVATIGSAGGFLFWAILSPPGGTFDMLQLSDLMARSAIIAVLFTGTLWCGRNYRALVHQATTNRHRALSLKTFKAFVDSTEDAHIKDSILMATTRSIFGHATTGLVSDGAAGKEPDIGLVIGQQPVANAATKGGGQISE